MTSGLDLVQVELASDRKLTSIKTTPRLESDRKWIRSIVGLNDIGKRLGSNWTTVLTDVEISLESSRFYFGVQLIDFSHVNLTFHDCLDLR